MELIIMKEFKWFTFSASVLILCFVYSVCRGQAANMQLKNRRRIALRTAMEYYEGRVKRDLHR